MAGYSVVGSMNTYSRVQERGTTGREGGREGGLGRGGRRGELRDSRADRQAG